ncbi:uncharacterized protein LOC120335962 [Styela clava]
MSSTQVKNDFEKPRKNRKRTIKTCESTPNPQKKRRRPNAAIRERERLKIFNDALETLQKAIPVRLPRGRKLHKKQTLTLASCYIRFLRGCLEGQNDWADRHRFLWSAGSQQEDLITTIDAAAEGLTRVETSQLQSVMTPPESPHTPESLESVASTSYGSNEDIFKNQFTVNNEIEQSTESLTEENFPPFYINIPEYHPMSPEEEDNHLDELLQDLNEIVPFEENSDVLQENNNVFANSTLENDFVVNTKSLPQFVYQNAMIYDDTVDATTIIVNRHVDSTDEYIFQSEAESCYNAENSVAKLHQLVDNIDGSAFSITDNLTTINPDEYIATSWSSNFSRNVKPSSNLCKVLYFA